MIDLPKLDAWPNETPFGFGAWRVENSPDLDALELTWPKLQGWRSSSHVHCVSKRYISDRERMNEHARAVLDFLGSEDFVDFLRRMSGVDDLVFDSSLEGGGLHEMGVGGRLDMHVDFNRLGTMWRRVNVILFVNSNWEPEWNGQLVLSSKPHLCERSTRFDVNPQRTLVAFEYGARSYHGVPFALACDQNTKRKSVAAYYYSKTRPRAYNPEKHSTLYSEESSVNG